MQNKKIIAELQDEMKEAEEECANIRNQIQKVEFLLLEKKKLLDTTYDLLLVSEEHIPVSPKECFKGVSGTPHASKIQVTKTIAKSAPRFMNSTAASRQRHNAEERETKGRTRSLRSGSRTSVQISSSQSISYSDTRFKILLKQQLPNKKSRYSEINTSLNEIVVCNGSDALQPVVTRAKMVSSDPNLAVTLNRHRRRMSDLI